MWNQPKIEIECVWIRHGMTIGNQSHRYIGRTDEPLSEEGKALLQRKWNDHNVPKADIVYCSPKKRCQMTASILYPDVQPVLVPSFVEIDFGDFEGKNYIELEKNPSYQAWIDSNGKLPFPNGESKKVFCHRVAEGFATIWKELCALPEEERPNRVSFVVHGGTMMAFFSSFAGGDYYSYHVENGEAIFCNVIGDADAFWVEEIHRKAREEEKDAYISHD